MAKFVPDIQTNRWVIIAPARITRPHDNTPHGAAVCPFCPAQDSLNQELFRIGDPWKIRVITNKYPLTDYHEVIIHSPQHDKDIHNLPLDQVKLILTTYRARFNFLKKNGSVLIFNNHDIHAGASLAHPHSQIVVVPPKIDLDAIPKEPIKNEVVNTDHFVAYCPDFSQWPYEIWIAPNESSSSWREPERPIGSIKKDAIASLQHDGDMFGSITDEQIKDLAPLLQNILAFIHKKFTGENDVPYNYYIYHGADWYLRIIPRLVHRAGFELGTGLSVNIVDPAEAAKEYREGLFSHS